MGTFIKKLLVPTCLMLAILPSLLYADYYAKLKVETYPVSGSTDVTKGVQFEIKVIACNEFGEQITPVTLGWDYAQFADIIFQSNDPNAKILNSLGNWVSLPGFQIRLDGGGDRIDKVILNTVGDGKRITIQQNPSYWSGIIDGYVDFKVHDFVNHFDINIPVGSKTAGVAFGITIYAKDSSENIAKTFNDDIDIWAVIPPDYTYEPKMDPIAIDGTSFVNGVATLPVTIYGSHPVSRLVRIKCENTVMHGGLYAKGESEDFAIQPNSYAKILLLVPGEEHRPGRLIGSGKEGIPSEQTAGEAFSVKVYTTDEYWNPIFASVPITFSSSDLAADLPNSPTMTTNPETFSVTFHTVGLGSQWLKITEGSKESASTDIPVKPNDIVSFQFDNNIPSPQITTDPFQINVTAYDGDGNVADYDEVAQLSCTMGAEYANPDTIQFTNGKASAWVQVTKMGLVKIIVDDGTHSAESNEFLILAGEFNKILVLLDGETHTPGLGDGKAGSPNPINAGDSPTVTIIACDDYWNRKAIPVEISDISSPTGHIVPPALPFTLADDGTGQCQVTFRTAYDVALGMNESQTITVSGGGRTGTSTPIVVNPGTYQKIVLVAPGEQLDPGTQAANGKSGSPSTQVAGSPFSLRVAATDSYWNPVNSGFPATITFTSGDTNALVQFAGLAQGSPVAMGARIKDFNGNNRLITLASPQWVRVSDGSKTDQVSVSVTHGSLDHFAFNTISVNPTAGDTIHNVTITAQDKYNNRVLSFGSSATLYCTSGQYTFIPTTASFASGQCLLDVTIYEATFPDSVKLTCSYQGKLGESNQFTVNPGTYAELILILPGQTHEPGNIVSQGKSGTPFPYKVGNPAIETTVYAVDRYWNRVHPPDPEPRVEITTEEYLVVDPANPWTLSNGEAIFWTTLKTAATGQMLVATDIGTSIDDSSKIDVTPGDFEKLQIIAPDEVPDPGSDLGKSGTIQPQVAGVSFDIVVRAVDQYWNLVPTINGESIDLISQADTTLDSRYPPKSFVNGEATFTIWLDGNNEDIDVTAINRQPPPYVDEATVIIHVDRGHKYVIEVPTYCVAGVGAPNVFSMTAKLVDENNQVVGDANNWFKMAPCLASDHSPATDAQGLGVKEFKLTNGIATFDQSYPVVEQISIAVSDDFGRGPVYSSAIDVRETGLRYKIDVPVEATAGKVFEMTVSLIDTGTGKVVPTRDRQVSLVPVSSASPGREGRLYVTTVGLSKGTWKITNQWYTKAETFSLKASDAEVYVPGAESNSSLPFNVLPGDLKKLQILAPGEEPRPGEIAYVETGKDSTNIQVQGTEINFPATVEGVDQYWNLVDEFSGGNVYLSSEGSFSSNPSASSLTHGMATFIVTLHQAGSSFTLKAEAKSPAGLEPQSVTIPMEAAIYQITTSVTSARTIDSFKLTVELVDPQTGQPKPGANNPFILTPYTIDGEVAPGEWTKTGGSSVLDNGRAEIWVNYDTVGKIRFKLSDKFGRPPAYTDPIDILPLGLRYDLEAPEKVDAGKEFSLTVKLIDTGAGNPVTTRQYSRQVKLLAYSSPDGNPAEGKLKKTSLYLEQGILFVVQSYDIAHDMYIEASDAQQYNPQATVGRTGDIEVIGAPVTVMKLVGVYNEINGALYLRESTNVSLLCTSAIKAETIFYRVDGGKWMTYKSPFVLSPGVHTVEYYGMDKYGHKEEINQTKTFYVSYFSDGVDGVRNRPNPFRAGKEETLIEYNLKEASNVTITIYDLLGQEVWRETYRRGENGGSTVNSVPWDGRNLSGGVVANGGYICHIWIENEKKQMSRKIAVAK